MSYTTALHLCLSFPSCMGHNDILGQATWGEHWIPRAQSEDCAPALKTLGEESAGARVFHSHQVISCYPFFVL